jgi:tRNA(fMet)-specific endonuclease VapC
MLIDTNLLLHYIRNQENLPANSYLTTITIGEIKFIAIRNNWGKQKLATLESIFDRFPILNIDYEMTDLYANIDAYSQGSLIEKPLPIGVSARNMGKNDL